MDDEKVASIVAAGYSKAQAKQALYENDGNVDDAIDSLFLKGRKSQRNVASNPTFDDEDVTVTDDSLASGAAAVSSSGPSIFAGQFSQARRSSDTTLSQITPSLGAAVIQSSRRHSGRGDSSAAARPKAPPRDTYYQKGIQTEENKDADSVGADTASKTSVSGASRSSARQHQRGTTSEPRAHAAALPGAFAIGSNIAIARNDNDDLMTGSTQPSLREITTAELVDPDQENQILERRLQEELERERQNAAVAEVVKESELKTCRWRRVACVVGFVLVALVVALSVSLTRPPKSIETAPPTPAPTYSPPPQEIIDLITPVSFDGGESLMDPTSPQSFAARWLAVNAELASYTDERKLQRYALATFYFSTDGDAWEDKQKWLTDSNECIDWWVQELEADDTKLECDASNAITLLLMEENNIAGTLPDEIAFLSNSLAELKLNDNKIGGTLPSTLGLMSRLRDLELNSNKFTGQVPSELGLMTTLEDLRIDDNELNGTIPTETVLMVSLDTLRLQSNNLDGTISPTMISSLVLLDTLRLSSNEFTGSIPTEIGLLTLLEELKLNENKLSGPMPSEIGLLTLLKDFACHENELTGTLPTEMGQMTALEDELRIGSNNFTGPIPSEFASFTSLGRLRMGDNKLTGTILSTFGLLHPTLNRLELQSNFLTGSIPEELGLLTLLSDLRLHANNLTGTIPSEFTQFTDLKGLNLHNNSFTGTIPPFGNLTTIKDFRADFNMLTGSIPSSIDRLISLEELAISNNALTGMIPNVLFDSTIFPNLLKVYLYNNSLTGNATCPPHIVDCFLSCFQEGNETCRTLS